MKQNVALEQKMCVVTGKLYNTNAIIINQRPVKDPSNKMYLTTGWGICPEEQAYIDDGYCIFVTCDETKLHVNKKQRANPEDIYRTGVVIRIKKKVASEIFNINIENVNFIDEETAKFLESLTIEKEE
jgi:hypothetical protein